MEQLTKLRERIDWLDSQIATLLNERMRATDQVGRIKRMHQSVVTDPTREKVVLKNVAEIVQHPVLKANIGNIYEEIMQESKIAQQFYQSLDFPFRRIGIIGLGLMGGSICKGIKMKDPTIEIRTMKLAAEDNILANEGGWIDHEHATLQELIGEVELIILATPLSSVIPLAEQIKQTCSGSKELIVIDIASVKQEITSAFERLSCQQVEYLATHPMAGKEKRGFSNSQPTLFVNRPWVIVPHRHNHAETVEKMTEVVRFLGAEPVRLEADVHDLTGRARFASSVDFI